MYDLEHFGRSFIASGHTMKYDITIEPEYVLNRTIIEDIKVDRCNETDWWNNLKLEGNLNKNTAKIVDRYGGCISNKELKISGALGEQKYITYLELRPKCRYPNPNCIKINDLRVYYGYYDTGVNPSNKENPMVRQLVLENQFDM